MDDTRQAAAAIGYTLQSRHSQSTMALNLVSNSYLEENTAKIRVKQVPWEVRHCCLRRLSPHTDCVNLD
jgi:hypothetical protein